MIDFDQLYQQVRPDGAGPSIPWDLDGPQPIVVELADTGEIVGPVLESGCGFGENALFLAGRGHRVTAFDISPTVIDIDRAKAAARGLAVDFRVADATVLDGIDDRFNTVVDSALMHCLTQDERRDYLAAVHRLTEPGARLHIICLPETDDDPPLTAGPMDVDSLRRDIGEHWRIDRMTMRRYTTGMSRPKWDGMAVDEPDRLPSGVATSAEVDEQGRMLLPVWQIAATRT